MILVIDNYDSFTFNLVHYLMELGAEVRVERNDALSAAEAVASGAKPNGRPEIRPSMVSVFSAESGSACCLR